MPKKLIKIDGSDVSTEERAERKRYVDRIRMQLNRGQLEGELQDYVDEYDEEHEFTIKEYDFQNIMHRRIVTQSVREPVRSEIRGEEEEEPSFIMQYGKAKKRLPQKPSSSLSPIIDGLFGESKTIPDVIGSGDSEEKEEYGTYELPSDNPKKVNPLIKSISDTVEGWKMFFGLLRGNLEIKKELEEEETI